MNRLRSLQKKHLKEDNGLFFVPTYKSYVWLNIIRAMELYHHKKYINFPLFAKESK